MTQYAPIGKLDTPADWIIPSSLEIVPVAIYANFDGQNGAAEFVPALDILSDSGHPVGRYVASETVAAGGYAEVSWAPFLRGSPKAATLTANLPYAIAYSAPTDTEQAVATGTIVSTVYHSFETSDPLLFTFPASHTGITTHADMLLQAFAVYVFDYALTPAAQYFGNVGQILLPIGWGEAAPYTAASGWVTGLFGPGNGLGGPPYTLSGANTYRVGKTVAGFVSPLIQNNSGFATPLQVQERILVLTCLAQT